MSTRAKLIVLVLITSIAGASSVFVNSLVLRPVRNIEKEVKILDNLKFSFIDYIAKANQLDTQDFRTQWDLVKEARTSLEGAFGQISKLKYLPALNEKIRSSIDTISLFSTFLTMNQANLDERIDKVVEIAETHLGKDSSFTVFQLAWGLDDLSEASADEVKQRVFFMTSGIVTLNKNAAMTLASLESQYQIISGEIHKFEGRARRTLGLILIIILTVPMVLALLIANMLADRIQKVAVGISRMRDGDLADRIEVNSRDEMGRLSRNVNDFTDALSASIRHIQDASKINKEVTDRLRSSVERVAGTTTYARESAESICEGMNTLNETVLVTESAVQTVDEQLGRLEAVLNDQVSMIEETTASVSQMIASVNNVSDITVKKKAALSNLVKFSNEGGAKLDETNRVVSAVHESVEEIQGTARIIADIASQTNLLAMNAAIEAAHAGDSGRGFAVVADEIRKLAEATSTNSKRIGGVMKAIIKNIEEAVISAQNTGMVFQRVDQEVSEASASFDEIARSMEELKVGGTQILEAMSRLNDISTQVQDSDVSMRTSSDANRNAIERVEHISSVTVEQVKRITEALESLVKEMEQVTGATKRADAISETLEHEVKMFKIGEA
ncbi:MAG: HAMP domain-containing protein [Spirochaetales bacterium]|nr:HAMP domain-containing protein [Spirochaetales bacterium]